MSGDDDLQVRILKAIAIVIADYEKDFDGRVKAAAALVAAETTDRKAAMEALRSELLSKERAAIDDILAGARDSLERSTLATENTRLTAEQQFRELYDRVVARLAEVKDGEAGPPGKDGAPGTAGAPGKEGEPGERGEPGDPGRDGEPGEKGERGDRGNDGDPGPKGDKGDPGEPGEKGDKGDTGDTGDPGEKGDSGEPGKPGDAGERGEKGDKGDTGDTGEPGERGERGEKGDPGERGERGEKGDTGLPGKAYVGDQGEKGDKGDPGEPGAPGLDGGKGEKGDRGPPGTFKAPVRWVDRAVYYDGDVVELDGSTYCARADTAERPPHDDWALVASRGVDGRTGEPRGAYDALASYRLLDIVSHDGSTWIAKKDDPGPLPGEGWMLGARAGGKGRPGDRGPKGDKGERGEAGIGVDSVALGDEYNAVVTLTNGVSVTLDFRPLFERYHAERGA